MRIFFLILICLLGSSYALADCAGTGLSVFPSGNILRQNTIIVLDGYAESQHVVLGLNKKYPVYLKSGAQKVRLLVKEVCTGQFFLTQAVLLPEKPLTAGLTYTMCIDGMPGYEALTRYNESTQEREAVMYIVMAGNDNSSPVIQSAPKEIKKVYRSYGCGPDIHVIFSLPVKDDSEMLVKATVKNLATGREATYYVEPFKNSIYIGHSMCSGAFTFDGSLRYEVGFAFTDASGNTTSCPGPRIQFTKPVNESSDHEEEE